MPLESIICRRKLDQERGNPQICECPMCREIRKTETKEIQKNDEKNEEGHERLFHGQ